MKIANYTTVLNLGQQDKEAVKQALWIATDVLNGLFVPAPGECDVKLNAKQKKELKQRINKIYKQLKSINYEK